MPNDDRAQEIGYAASFLVLVGSDFSWEGVGQVMHYDTTIPTVIGAVTAAAVAIDVWKRAGSTSKMVLNGMNRLFLKDVERESRAEAGAFLTAYVTGLPCFAFQPSAVEALRYVLTSSAIFGALSSCAACSSPNFNDDTAVIAGERSFPLGIAPASS